MKSLMNHFCIFKNLTNTLLVQAGGAVLCHLFHVDMLLSESRPYVLSYFFFFALLSSFLLSLYTHVLLQISNSNGGIYAFT